MTLSIVRATLVAAGLCLATLGRAETLTLINITNDSHRYADGLLKLALSKVETPYDFQNSAEATTTARIIEMLDADQLDVFWVATSNEYEQAMLPIRVPLFRGLLGYRVFMIKKGNQYKFNGISNLQDLRRISIGQGRAWSDTRIMEANGLDVVKVTRYPSLFFMLDGDRFDAFPRGVQEPWSEISSRPDLALTVEDNLMLSYTSPFYFFVKNGNRALAQDIEEGLMRALGDGSFQDYFINDPTVRDVLAKANLKQRTVIHLENPLLPPKTPVDRDELWLDPYQL